MSSESFDSIMTGITAKLTGDAEADLACLREQMEAYKDHPLSQEILRACGRMMWDLLPDEDKAKINDALRADAAGHDSVFEEVAFNQSSGNIDKALELIEPLAQQLAEAMDEGMFADDTESLYFDFDSLAQAIVWDFHNEDEREVRRPPAPLCRTFFTYGSCLYDAGRYEEAIEALKRAIRWNPAKPVIRFELGENYKKLDDMDAYERVLNEVHPYIATASDMARFHRSKGFMLVERERYELAAAHLMYSLLYEESNLALSEIMYIKMHCGQDYTDLTPETAAEILERNNELSGANEDTLSALFALMKGGMESGDLDIAVQAAIDLYELTGDEEIADVARSLMQAIREASAEDAAGE